jgi:hypothetical protein
LGNDSHRICADPSPGEVVRFTCDPAALLGALAEQRLPTNLPPAEIELRLSADGTISL